MSYHRVNEYVECPFDKNHKVPPAKLANHMVKCKRVGCICIGSPHSVDKLRNSPFLSCFSCMKVSSRTGRPVGNMSIQCSTPISTSAKDSTSPRVSWQQSDFKTQTSWFHPFLLLFICLTKRVDLLFRATTFVCISVDRTNRIIMIQMVTIF